MPPLIIALKDTIVLFDLFLKKNNNENLQLLGNNKFFYTPFNQKKSLGNQDSSMLEIYMQMKKNMIIQ